MYIIIIIILEKKSTRNSLCTVLLKSQYSLKVSMKRKECNWPAMSLFNKAFKSKLALLYCQGMTRTFFPTCPVGQVDEFSTCPTGKTSCPCQILKINHFD